MIGRMATHSTSFELFLVVRTLTLLEDPPTVHRCNEKPGLFGDLVLFGILFNLDVDEGGEGIWSLNSEVGRS